MDVDEKVLSDLELKALERKNRLKTLTENNSKNNEEPADSSENNDMAAFPTPIFRSYRPTDESLKEAVLEQPKLIDIESIVKEELDIGKSKQQLEDVDLTALAPRKIDWDLKKDLEKKLKKLEKRTQLAIAELVRERLLKEQDISELATAGPNIEDEPNE